MITITMLTHLYGALHKSQATLNKVPGLSLDSQELRSIIKEEKNQ